MIFRGLFFSSLATLLFLACLCSSAPTLSEEEPVQNLFFIGYEESCYENTSILEALEKANAIPEDSLAQFEENLNTIMGGGLNYEINPLTRQFSEMSLLERRDLSIAALDAFVALKNPEHQQYDVSTTYLEQLAVDIIDDSLLPENELFIFSQALPCMRFSPERQIERFPIAVKPSSDFMSTARWYMGNALNGIGASSAKQCYDGESDGPTVAILDSDCSQPADLVLDLETYVTEKVTTDFERLCSNCQIMCIKIGNAKSMVPTSNILKAINYLLKSNIKVSNHGYGGFGPLAVERFALEVLGSSDHLAVFAAGNEGCNISTSDSCKDTTGKSEGLEVPAGYGVNNAITVGTSDQSNKIASFSNWGTKVKLFVPGDDVPEEEDAKAYPLYIGGTSFSARVVSEAAGLLLGHDPSLTVAQLRDLILETVRKVPELSNKCESGGILDLAAAMKKLSEKKPCNVSAKLPFARELQGYMYYGAYPGFSGFQSNGAQPGQQGGCVPPPHCRPCPGREQQQVQQRAKVSQYIAPATTTTKTTKTKKSYFKKNSMSNKSRTLEKPQALKKSDSNLSQPSILAVTTMFLVGFALR